MEARAASRDDLAAVVALVTVEDRVAEVEPTEAHVRAFAAIEADPRNELLVLDDGGLVVGCLQITYIPGLGRGGGERALIEAVRVRADRRNAGLGRALIQLAIERARARGCVLVQLTSNKRRAEAHRFYGSLGFVASHDGFKLALEPPAT